MCNILIETNQIYGCGKPFQIIVKDNGDWIIQKCDYIWKLYKGFSMKFKFF